MKNQLVPRFAMSDGVDGGLRNIETSCNLTLRNGFQHFPNVRDQAGIQLSGIATPYVDGNGASV